MKYQFNKIFLLLIKKEIAGKPHFDPDLGLLGPNLGYNFLFEISALLDVRYCPKLLSCAMPRKTNDANLRKSKNLISGTILGPRNFCHDFYLY